MTILGLQSHCWYNVWDPIPLYLGTWILKGLAGLQQRPSPRGSSYPNREVLGIRSKILYPPWLLGPNAIMFGYLDPQGLTQWGRLQVWSTLCLVVLYTWRHLSPCRTQDYMSIPRTPIDTHKALFMPGTPSCP